MNDARAGKVVLAVDAHGHVTIVSTIIVVGVTEDDRGAIEREGVRVGTYHKGVAAGLTERDEPGLALVERDAKDGASERNQRLAAYGPQPQARNTALVDIH